MEAPITIGTGFKRFLFEVGELGMMHVEIQANSREEAVRYISTGRCIQDFPAYMRNEIRGEEFRLIEET